LLIKHIKSVLWRVAKRLSDIEDARCLKVKGQAGAMGWRFEETKTEIDSNGGSEKEEIRVASASGGE